MPNKKSVSLKKIASELSLSINTVSRALRDCDDISEETKRRVRQKADELGYYSNKSKERSLFPKTKTIVLVLNDLANAYFLRLSNLLSRHYQEKGYQVFLMPLLRQSLDAESLKECILRSADLVVSFFDIENSAAAYAAQLGLKIILVGRESPNPTINDIYADDFHGGEIASEYLAKKGCQRRLYIGLAPVEVSYRRLNGFTSDGQKRGLETLFYDWKELDEAVEAIQTKNVTGIFTFNDKCAVQLIDHLKEKGADLTKLSIVGFDNTAHSLGYQNYRFASVSADYDELVNAITSVSEAILNQNEGTVTRKKIAVSLDDSFAN